MKAGTNNDTIEAMGYELIRNLQKDPRNRTCRNG